MANITEEYKCDKCGRTLLKINKLLHDLKCEQNDPIPNNNNKDSIFNDYLLNNNSDNIYICEICNMKLKAKDKTDHLLCHELENNNNNNNNNIFSSISNYDNLNYSKHYPLPSININRRRIINDEIEDEDEEDEVISDASEEIIDEFENDDLNEIAIQTYPTSKIKDINKLDEDKKRCTICLEFFKNNDDSIALPCVHIFHAECIKKWMKKQKICPICKNKIIE